MEKIEMDENSDVDSRGVFPNKDPSCLDVKDLISKGIADGLEEGASSILSVPPLEDQSIETLLVATNKGIREFNEIESVGNAVVARQAVLNGNNFNALKIMVHAAGKIWQDFTGWFASPFNEGLSPTR